jgi:hypothetical protein
MNLSHRARTIAAIFFFSIVIIVIIFQFNNEIRCETSESSSKETVLVNDSAKSLEKKEANHGDKFMAVMNMSAVISTAPREWAQGAVGEYQPMGKR